MARSLRKVFTGRNVLEAAKGRCRDIFMEYDDKVFVSFSGGKGSTVIFNLMVDAAEEMGYLPLKVIFVDQEADWQGTVGIMRVVMDDPRVHPIWVQLPIMASGFSAGSRAPGVGVAVDSLRPERRKSPDPYRAGLQTLTLRSGPAPRRRSAGRTYPGPWASGRLRSRATG